MKLKAYKQFVVLPHTPISVFMFKTPGHVMLVNKLKQESAWLKRKLSENKYTFSHRLDASARYIASKAPVLPTHGLRAVHTAVSASVTVSVSLSLSFVLACVCVRLCFCLCMF